MTRCVKIITVYGLPRSSRASRRVEAAIVQPMTQILNFILKFPDELIFRIIFNVHRRSVVDRFRSVSIF